MSRANDKCPKRLALRGAGFAAVAVSLFAGACGGDASTLQVVGGESHFLQKCGGAAAASCGDGLDCIAGICTVSCLVSERTCSALHSGASCTASSVEPGVVAVCDVSCSTGGDCAPLGDAHRCEAGFCRAPAASGSIDVANPDSTPDGGAGGTGGTGGAGGAAGTSSGAGGSSDDLDCTTYRDNPGSVEVEVVIENARSTPVYLHTPCDAPSRLVEFDRFVQLPAFDCGLRHCEEIQLDGQWSEPCPGKPCGPSARIRLEPGAQISAGRFRSELLTFTGATAMPEACFNPTDQLPIGGITCYAETPLSGTYGVSAVASSLLNCPDPRDGECDCTPDASGSCQIGIGQSGGDLLDASIQFTVPATRATITFQE